MKKLLTILTVFAVILSCMTFTANAESDSSIRLRIEGVNKNLYYDIVNLNISETTTVSDVLRYADEQSEQITISGIDKGFITDINGETMGQFGGYDGWYYTVNDVAPEVGIDGYTVSNGDSIVLYYGDYPCQYPRVNINQFYKGVLKFESYDTTYDENWNPSYEWMPIAGATVTLGDSTYTTDETGKIYADTTKLFGLTKIQIEKKSESGAPAVCRFEDDYCIMYNDVNKDGQINVNDATAIQKHLADIIILDEESLSVSDLNNDGDIDIRDVTAIQRMILEAD